MAIDEPEGTGDCYTVALELVIGKPEGWFLIHGTVVGDGGDVKGTRYDHAWVQNDGMIYDLSNGRALIVSVAEYRKLADFHIERVYRSDQAASLATKTGHAGPWHNQAK